MWQSTPKSDRPGRIEIEDSTDRRIKAVAVDDDGLITVAGMENVALAFIGVPDVRERQADLIQQKLITIADRAGGRLAVSLSEVATMTSAGVNALLAVHLHCEKLGAHLALFAMSRDLMRMFRVTRLDRKLVITETAHEAVRSFTSPPKRGFLRAAFSWARQDRDAA